jgi:hypothetical protein
MTRLLAASTALALVGALPVAAADRHSRGTTFEGSCVGYGTAVLSPPVSWVPAPIDGEWRSQGVCSGTLNGEAVLNVPFEGQVVIEDYLASCAGGAGSVVGSMVFRHHGLQGLAFTVDMISALTDRVMVLHGASSGTAAGRKESLPAVADRSCTNGGKTHAALALSFTTLTPLVG